MFCNFLSLISLFCVVKSAICNTTVKFVEMEQVEEEFSTEVSSKKTRLEMSTSEVPWREQIWFPEQFCLFKVYSVDDKYATHVYLTANRDNILQAFQRQKPGLKSRAGSRDLKSENEIKKLGKLPKNSIPGWHSQKTSFPPAIEVNYWACQKVDLNNRPATSKRQTYIEEVPCVLRCTERVLSVGEVSLFTFEKGHHAHSCLGMNIHLLPWTSQEKLFVLKLLMRYDSTKEIFEKVLHPAIQKCQAAGEVPTRLLSFTEGRLNAQAKRWGINKQLAPGKADLIAVKSQLLQFQEEGAIVAYKLPGHSVYSSEVVLLEESKPFLHTKDLFVFIMTRLQARLLKRFGTCVSSDGTHAIFSYNNVKLIVVLVSSYVQRQEETFTERGFPVAMAITTSERDEIHKAIVVHLRAGVGKDWVPSILMTDMALSAYNGWLHFFPHLVLLWCKFHVWQAWIKKLTRAVRPDGLTKEQWSILKGKLIQEIKELISPKEEPEMSFEDFQNRCEDVSDVMWGTGLLALAESFDQYGKNKNRWSPPARRDAVVNAFSTTIKMPMLAKTNNALERFFGVLKHVILKGMSVKTMFAFLCIWRVYQSRIFVNAVQSRVLPVLPALGDILKVEEQIQQSGEDGVEPFASDDEDDKNDENDEDDENVEESDNKATHEMSDTDGVDFETMMLMQQQQHWETERQTFLRKIAELSKLAPKFEAMQFGEDSSTSIDEFRTLSNGLGNVNNAATAALNNEDYDGKDLSFTRKQNPFRKQRDNFDDTPCFVPNMSVVPLDRILGSQPTSRLSCPKENADSKENGTSNQLQATDPDQKGATTEAKGKTRKSLESATVDVNEDESEEIDLSGMYKKKQKRQTKKASPEWLLAQKQPFKEYARSFLTAEVRARIQTEKELAKRKGLPLLRVAFSWNISNRIRAIGFELFTLKFPKSSSKEDLISRLLTSIMEFASPIPEEIASEIADIGIVHKSDEGLERGEIVYLRANATSNAGEGCVAACENLVGWVVRNKHFVAFSVIPITSIYWGRLEEKR